MDKAYAGEMQSRIFVKLSRIYQTFRLQIGIISSKYFLSTAMDSQYIAQLPKIFQSLTDPRYRRGKRHPYSPLCTLVFIGLLAKIIHTSTLVEWAKTNWKDIKEPLGFTRKECPSETTFSRCLAKLSLDEFRKAVAQWLQAVFDGQETLYTAAVDGKVCKQGLDENGKPELIVNVFLQGLKMALTQWQAGELKTNEPGCLKEHLDELCEQFPLLQLLTTDAGYTQRPLLQAIRDHGLDYLVQVKDNQPEVKEALEVCFDDTKIGEPDAKSDLEKKR
jgi:hypothetical protein